MIRQVEAYQTEDGQTHLSREAAVAHVLAQTIGNECSEDGVSVNVTTLTAELATNVPLRAAILSLLGELG